MKSKDQEIRTKPPGEEREGKTLVNLIFNGYTDESAVMINGNILPGVAGLEVSSSATIHLIDGQRMTLAFDQQIFNLNMWLDDYQLMQLVTNALKADEK